MSLCTFKSVLTWEEYGGPQWDWKLQWQPVGSVPEQSNPLLPETLPDLHYSEKERDKGERERNSHKHGEASRFKYHIVIALEASSRCPLLLSRGELEWNLKQSDPQRIPAKSQKCTTPPNPPTATKNQRRTTNVHICTQSRGGLVWQRRA